MGIYDREYVRVGPRSPSGLGWMSAWSMNTWIIAINVAVFILMAMGGPKFAGAVEEWGHFSTAKALFYVGVNPLNKQHVVYFGLEIWRFITFQFLHANAQHVLFNMIALFFFGGMVENYLGRTRYLAFYLTCGVFGAVMYVILNLLGQLPGAQNLPFLLINDPTLKLVGASAGVFGVLLACAFIAPNAQILLFFVFPMRLATAVYLFVGIAFFAVYSRSQNAGGEAAHIGGAIAGAYFIRHTHLLRDFFDIFGKRAPRKSRAKPANAKAVPGESGPVIDEAEMDRILSKIATQGMQSLTDKERRTLRRATESKRR
ncbi:MAG: rhomboid family intramembrane serine protease [Phycisphaeraceae bacterium]|nr:rhomboid family intramembrane serine protease [Phycisphaeraceae bacterium]